MQANEFEKNVQNKLEKLELVPHGDVWAQVFARISKEKSNRRVLFFWIFAAFVMLTATVSYLFIVNENNKKLLLDEITHNSAKKENYKTKQNIQKSSVKTEKLKKIRLKKSTAHLKKRNIKLIKPLSGLKEKTNDLIKKSNKQVAAGQLVFTTGKPKLPASQPALPSKQKEYKRIYNKEEKDAQKGLIMHKYYNPGGAPVKTVKDSTDSKKDTAVNKTATKTVRTNRTESKKWQTGFTVYTGISDNVSGLSSLTKAYSQFDRFSAITSPNGSNYSNQPYLLNSFKSALSFGIGVFAKKQLTKRVGFSAGVDYHFYSAKSAVGSKVNQQTNFYDSLALKSTFVDGYYTAGNSVTYSNHYHLLELPINLLLCFSKNTNKSLLLTAGVSPGYLIASNALYANPSANVYYADKQKLHRFQLSAQSGLLFPVVNSPDFILHAGPAVQYGLTNTSKSAANARQHLFFAGIKANIIFR